MLHDTKNSELLCSPKLNIKNYQSAQSTQRSHTGTAKPTARGYNTVRQRLGYSRRLIPKKENERNLWKNGNIKCTDYVLKYWFFSLLHDYSFSTYIP